MVLAECISKEYCKINEIYVIATHKIPKKSRMGSRWNSLRDIVPRGSLFYTQFLKEFYFLKQIKNEDVIIDIGCGEAVLLEKLRRNGNKCKYIGIDLSSAALTRAFLKEDSILIQDDFSESLPVKDETADIVICSEVIEHFDKEGGEHLLQEIARVLKPNGSLVITTSRGKDKPLAGHLKEYMFDEFKSAIEERFSIKEEYGLYVDDKTLLSEKEVEILEVLKYLYPAPFLRSILAARHPESSRSYMIKAVKEKQ